MVLILTVVLYRIYCCANSPFTNLYLLQGQVVETIWTTVPIFFLVIIGYPSLQVLYTLEEVKNVDWTVKVIGHQWY